MIIHLSPHVVVREASRAAGWYVQALGATEHRRIPVPGDEFIPKSSCTSATPQ